MCLLAGSCRGLSGDVHSGGRLPAAHQAGLYSARLGWLCLWTHGTPNKTATGMQTLAAELLSWEYSLDLSRCSKSIWMFKAKYWASFEFLSPTACAFIYQTLACMQVLHMHDSGLTDLALSALVKGCQQLAYLSIQGPPLRPICPAATAQRPLACQRTVTDTGLKDIAEHCTQLKGLSITRKLPFAPSKVQYCIGTWSH